MSNQKAIEVSDVLTEIRRFIIENFLFGSEEEVPTDEASLLGNGIIDSTGVLEIVTLVESRYEIEVSDDEMLPENFDSLRDVAEYVKRKKHQQGEEKACL